MTQPDLNTAIDAVWPDLRAAQQRCIKILCGILIAAAAVIVLAAQSDEDAGIIVAVVAFIVLMIAAFGLNGVVKKVGAALNPTVLGLTGFSEGAAIGNLSYLQDRGVLPRNATCHPGLSLSCALPPHTVMRTRLSVSVQSRDSDGDSKTKTYFDGLLVQIDGLAPAPQSTLIVANDWSSGSRRIRSLLRTHWNMAWRSDDEAQTAFGEVVQSPPGSGAALTALLAQINTTLPVALKLFSALREDDRLTLALSGSTPGLNFGGLMMSRISVEQQVDATLSDIAATLDLAAIAIAAEAG